MKHANRTRNAPGRIAGAGSVFGGLGALYLRGQKYINGGDSRPETAAVRKSLGEAIKARRTECNMTQEFVAGELGVSRQAVSKWESGASDPSTANLLALCKLFGVSTEELLRGLEERKKFVLDRSPPFI